MLLVCEIQIWRRHPTGGEKGGELLYLARHALNDCVRFILDASFHLSKNLETGAQL